MPNFRRSLIGYNAESVDKTIQDREAHFNFERETLNRELATETHQLELLRVEVTNSEEDLEKKLKLKEYISKQLFNAYILGVGQRLESIRAAEKQQGDVIDKITERTRERDVLKQEIQAMHNDFYAIADRYKKVLNKSSLE